MLSRICGLTQLYTILHTQVSYSLTQLSKNQLGRDRKELVPSQIPGMYGSSASLLELVSSSFTVFNVIVKC